MDPGVLSRCIFGHDIDPPLFSFSQYQLPQSIAFRYVEPMGLPVLAAWMTTLFHEAVHHGQPSQRPVLGPSAGLHSADSRPTPRRTFARLLLAPPPLNRIELAGAFQEHWQGCLGIIFQIFSAPRASTPPHIDYLFELRAAAHSVSVFLF